MILELSILFGVALLIILLVGGYVSARLMVRPPRKTVGTVLARTQPIDPGDAGFEYETFEWKDQDGVSQEGWVIDGRVKDGPVILVLHGWGDSRYGMLLWMQIVAGIAGKVVVIDQRGHGDSEQPYCTWGDEEVDDAVLVIEWIREQWTGRKLLIFGFSFGGAVGTLTCNRIEGVDGLIMDSPYATAYEVTLALVKLRELPKVLIQCAQIYLSARTRRMLKMPIDEAVVKIKCPILILHGVNDRIAEVEKYDEVAKRGDHIQLERFENSGHLEAACVDPLRYLTCLNNFVNKIA